MSNIERALASIQEINGVYPIDGADKICQYGVNGWRVVDHVGKYNVGDRVVYFEIDSFLPNSLCPFLSKDKEPKEFNGVKGERLRSIKLRKALSQGLIMPTSCLTNYGADLEIGEDVTAVLGIQKWERPLPACLAGVAKGNFPSFLVKTDQERAQNIWNDISQMMNEQFEVTIKLDGSSGTYFVKDNEFGVCSRNLELKESDTNAFWQVTKKYKIEEFLRWFTHYTGYEYAVQGEVLATNIQSNYEKVNDLEFYIFDIFNITLQRYLSVHEREMLYPNLNQFELRHVPVIDVGPLYKFGTTLQELLNFAEGPGMNPGVRREGIVFKHTERDFSFKVISNEYLCNEKD